MRERMHNSTEKSACHCFHRYGLSEQWTAVASVGRHGHGLVQCLAFASFVHSCDSFEHWQRSTTKNILPGEKMSTSQSKQPKDKKKSSKVDALLIDALKHYDSLYVDALDYQIQTIINCCCLAMRHRPLSRTRARISLKIAYPTLLPTARLESFSPKLQPKVCGHHWAKR